jgi:hypothetical protein
MDNDALSDNIHPNSPSYVIVITAFAGLITATTAFIQTLPIKVFSSAPRTQLQSNADSTKSGNANRSSREQLSPPAVSYCNNEEEWGRIVRSNDTDSLLAYIRQCRPDGKFLPAAERELESRLFNRASECIQNASSCNLNSCIDVYVRPLPNGQRAQALNTLAARSRESNPLCRPPPPPEPRPFNKAEPPNVRRHFGMDAPGNDRGSWVLNVDSLEDCESICLADPGCAGYTYNVRRTTCIPKSRIGSLVQHNEQPVTGEILGRAGRSIGPKVTRLSNMDAPGNDLRWVRGVGTVDECERLCLAESNCAGYTYNKAKFTCIPKDSIGSMVPSRDPAITGVVGARNTAR